jgi:hypothetical protein
VIGVSCRRDSTGEANPLECQRMRDPAQRRENHPRNDNGQRADIRPGPGRERASLRVDFRGWCAGDRRSWLVHSRGP